MGASTAERAPSTSRARPSAAARQAARRSPAERPEWNTAMLLGGKARRETGDGLPGETDLGHQHEDAVTRAQHRLGGAQVDLGLAAARDAVQQDRLAAAGRGEDLPSAASCSGSSVGAASAAPAPRAVAGRPHEVVGQETGETARAQAGVPSQRLLVDTAMAPQVGERRLLAGAEPRRLPSPAAAGALGARR